MSRLTLHAGTAGALTFLSVLSLSTGPVLAQAGGAAATASSDWLSYNGSYANDRFSPLGEITAANVARLGRVCTFTTNDSVSFQASPVVVNGVIYVSTYNTTYAVDGNSCVERWHNTRPAPRPFLPVNRGVGYADGRIFRGTSDAHLLALDTAGGRTLWDIALGDAAKGESIPMAPVSWHGMLFVGTAGGDIDVRARVYAIDPATGRELWHFETVADSGASAATWLKRSAQNPPAGGGLWTLRHRSIWNQSQRGTGRWCFAEARSAIWCLRRGGA
jgi:alcohol dehydrogenase (cytochrome c)